MCTVFDIIINIIFNVHVHTHVCCFLQPRNVYVHVYAIFSRPLQRMVIGMFLGGLAFIIAGVVQFEVQAGDKTLKAGETKLVMFNALPYEAPFNIEAMDNINGLHNINADKNFTLPSGGVSMVVCVCEFV